MIENHTMKLRIFIGLNHFACIVPAMDATTVAAAVSGFRCDRPVEGGSR
jgi:hypothetical protein